MAGEDSALLSSVLEKPFVEVCSSFLGRCLPTNSFGSTSSNKLLALEPCDKHMTCNKSGKIQKLLFHANLHRILKPTCNVYIRFCLQSKFIHIFSQIFEAEIIRCYNFTATSFHKQTISSEHRNRYVSYLCTSLLRFCTIQREVSNVKRWKLHSVGLPANFWAFSHCREDG